MKSYTNLDNFYYAMRFVGRAISIWPVRIGATKFEILVYEIKWWLSFLNVSSLVLPLFLGVYYFRNDSVAMTKSLSELTAIVELYVNIIQCKIYGKNFQEILHQIEQSVKNSDKYERKILQKYIDKYKHFQLFVASSFASTGILFTFLPIFTSQPFPADTWYPFSIEPIIVRILLYSTQVIVICQTAFGVDVDLVVAMMFWYSAAQLELLQKAVEEAKDEEDMKKCIRQHQELIPFIDKVTESTRFIILKATGNMLVLIVCGAFQLITHQPLEVTSRFVLLIGAACLKLYLSALPADDLQESNENLARTVLGNAMSKKSLAAAKIAFLMGFRCQKPFVIKVTGLIQAYTLQYYGSFLATSVKYFVNIRAVFEE